jgi:hypothetical protein
MYEREHAPMSAAATIDSAAVPSVGGAAGRVQSDPGTWGLLLVPVVICLALLLFVGLSPDTSSARPTQPNPAGQCRHAAPEPINGAGSAC